MYRFSLGVYTYSLGIYRFSLGMCRYSLGIYVVTHCMNPCFPSSYHSKLLRCAPDQQTLVRADTHFEAQASLEPKQCACTVAIILTTEHISPWGLFVYCLLRRVLTALTYLLSPCVYCNDVNRHTGGEAR